ncbi:5,10-methenyltetrahydrofolate synthetase [Pichia californica]|uniref:5-formyltetrahydrofolate cyclo-ligase n=1 Tax=Pichia californica TaxID=460514 RepID=A0A9P6WNW6_9ASCO|nr:5,10-methenyltetrahydrofolate synthetase [[Candida] californica]KAG0690594.1 5,10-methenyltetrahydrofolate synthetase [[Candida] californica]
MSLRTLKNATRKEIGNKLNVLDNVQIKQQSDQTANTLSTFPPFQKAQNIAVYLNLPNKELHTDKIITNCLNSNKKVYLPRIELLNTFNDYKNFPNQKSCLHFLSINNQFEIDNLQLRGKYKIREPNYHINNSNDLLLNNEKLDLILLPGVAFSNNCMRLGHGAGFYDDFIKRYREKYNEIPLLVGIGLPDQLIDDHKLLHIEDHDEPLDFVIIADHIYSSNKQK